MPPKKPTKTVQLKRNDVPMQFRRGHPIAESVGDLKKLLSELPDSLPIHNDGGGLGSLDGVCLIVFNLAVGSPGEAHLQFCDPETWENR